MDLESFRVLIQQALQSRSSPDASLQSEHAGNHANLSFLTLTRALKDNQAASIQMTFHLDGVLKKLNSTEEFSPFVENADRKYFVDDLLALEDKSFIRAAYAALLGRKADVVGFNAYLSHLRGGMPKFEILNDIHISNEGQAFGATIIGLNERVHGMGWRRLPIVGWIFAAFFPLLSNDQLERKIRQVDGRLANEIETQSAYIRHVLRETIELLSNQTLAQSKFLSKFVALSLANNSSEYPDCETANDKNGIGQEARNAFSRAVRSGPDVRVGLISQIRRSYINRLD